MKGTASVRRGSLASEIIAIVFDFGARTWGKHIFDAAAHHPAIPAHVASTVKRARISQIGGVVVDLRPSIAAFGVQQHIPPKISDPRGAGVKLIELFRAGISRVRASGRSVDIGPIETSLDAKQELVAREQPVVADQTTAQATAKLFIGESIVRIVGSLVSAP